MNSKSGEQLGKNTKKVNIIMEMVPAKTVTKTSRPMNAVSISVSKELAKEATLVEKKD